MVSSFSHHSGSKESVTYPVSSDSDVDNKVQRRLGDSSPDTCIVDAGSSDLVELVAIKVPGDLLVDPVAVGAVNVHTPCVPALIGDASATTDTGSLIADAAGIDVTVDGSVTSQLPIDSLHDIDLATRGPASTSAESISEHPEGWPDALLSAGGAVAESKLAFETGNPAVLGSEGILALHTAGSPSLSLGRVPPGNQLERVASADLDVPVGAGIDLQLVVNAQVAGDDVPVALVGGGTRSAREGVLPDAGEARVGWRVPGGSHAGKGKDECEIKANHLD